MATSYHGPERRGSAPDRRAGPSTRLLIAAANRLYRAGLVHALGSEPDFDVIGETDAVAATVAAALDAVPDVAVVDLDLPDPGGLAATRRIRHDGPSIAVDLIEHDGSRGSGAAPGRDPIPLGPPRGLMTPVLGVGPPAVTIRS